MFTIINSEIRNADQRIAEALRNWGGGGNYEKAAKWGRKLEQLLPYMPAETKQAPTNTLFRLIIVKQPLLDKILNENKPLILKNRRYSSWTSSARAAAQFTKNRHLSRNEAYVILQKTFTPNEILVNVFELASYLSKRGLMPIYEYMHDEQEIIVRNTSNDYKLTLKNIGLWKNYDTGKWVRP